MRYISKLITPAILALSLAGLAACGSSEQAPSSDAVIEVAAVKVIEGKVAETVDVKAAEIKQIKAPVVQVPAVQVPAAKSPAAPIKVVPVQAVPVRVVRTQPVQIQPVQPAPVQITQIQPEPAPVVQAPEAAPVVSAAPVAPATVKNWIVDASASHLKFSALQEGEPFEGSFKTFAADIRFSPDNLAASSVTVTVPISGADAGSTDRNSTLPGKSWFSAKKFPDAVFTAKTFKRMGEGAYEAAGALTIKGTSQPLSLPFTLDIENGTGVMRSTLEMNRNDWNIGAKPWNTDEYVSTGVKLDIMVTAQVEN